MDEYGPELDYEEGSANIVTDTFSWLFWNDTPMLPVVGKKGPTDENNNWENDLNETPFEIFSHGPMTEKCLVALQVFLMKNVTLAYQMIWLTTALWT